MYPKYLSFSAKKNKNQNENKDALGIAILRESIDLLVNVEITLWSFKMRMPENLDSLANLLFWEHKAGSIYKDLSVGIYKAFLIGNKINKTNQNKTEILKLVAGLLDHPELISTIGSDFKTKTLHIFEKEVKLQMWEKGTEEAKQLNKASLIRMQVGFLVCDLTQKGSLDFAIDTKKHIDALNTSLITILLCTNSNAYPKDAYSDEELNKLVALHNIKAWFKVDTQDPAGKIKIIEALTFAAKQCYLIYANPCTMHALLRRSQHSKLLHSFAHSSPEAALLFLSLFLHNKTMPFFPKDIWLMIFTHFFGTKVSQETCEALALDLTKARLAYWFLNCRWKKGNVSEPIRLVETVLRYADDISILRDGIFFAKNEGQHPMLEAWKSKVTDEPASFCNL